ncbi:hypothetical protein [Pseudomonas putida]|uniref:hypothetical protein n=1 Tax=Pseudomonas putida TaxID=303 RepID=UPI0039067429
MYTLYFAPTANGHKILIMLEALGVPYRIRRINLAQGEQHQPDFDRLCQGAGSTRPLPG